MLAAKNYCVVRLARVLSFVRELLVAFAAFDFPDQTLAELVLHLDHSQENVRLDQLVGTRKNALLIEIVVDDLLEGNF